MRGRIGAAALRAAPVAVGWSGATGSICWMFTRLMPSPMAGPAIGILLALNGVAAGLVALGVASGAARRIAGRGKAGS
jgi:hypothetical protein